MSKEQERLLLTSLVGNIILGLIILALIIGSTIDGTSQAQAYNLNCLTEPTAEPLKECKE